MDFARTVLILSRIAAATAYAMPESFATSVPTTIVQPATGITIVTLYADWRFVTVENA
jgi:hypothetical protein